MSDNSESLIKARCWTAAGNHVVENQSLTGRRVYNRLVKAGMKTQVHKTYNISAMRREEEKILIIIIPQELEIYFSFSEHFSTLLILY